MNNQEKLEVPPELAKLLHDDEIVLEIDTHISGWNGWTYAIGARVDKSGIVFTRYALPAQSSQSKLGGWEEIDAEDCGHFNVTTAGGVRLRLLLLERASTAECDDKSIEDGIWFASPDDVKTGYGFQRRWHLWDKNGDSDVKNIWLNSREDVDELMSVLTKIRARLPPDDETDFVKNVIRKEPGK